MYAAACYVRQRFDDCIGMTNIGMTDGRGDDDQRRPVRRGVVGTSDTIDGPDIVLPRQRRPEADRRELDTTLTEFAAASLREPQWDDLNRELLRWRQFVLAQWVASSAAPPSFDLPIEDVKILGLVAEGLGNKQIEQKLSLDEDTVRKALARMGRKLHTGGNRVKLVVAAMRAGLIR